MKTARIGVMTASLILCGVGYFVSQASFFFGSTANYVSALDQSSIPVLSTLLLLAAVVLGFVPNPDGEKS